MRFRSVLLFVVLFIVGIILMTYVPSHDTPSWVNQITALTVGTPPFALIGAILARISRKVALILIGIGTVALIIGIIIVRMEPEGILTGLIPLCGLGFILGALAHRLLDRSRPHCEH